MLVLLPLVLALCSAHAQPLSAATPPPSTERTLALLLPLLVLVSTLLFLLLLFLVFLVVVRSRNSEGRIRIPDSNGPTDVTREPGRDEQGGVQGAEERYVASRDEGIQSGYHRAKAWQEQYPPNSQPTDITHSQYLNILEKGVSAWSFEPSYETNPPLLVQSRTEIVFLDDAIAPAEGGGASVLSNLPIPRQNEVYYFECKMFDKPPETIVAVGLATKPYPWFRLPGWNKHSVAYTSAANKCYDYPFSTTSYGQSYAEGDTIGVGYRPRTGSVFFTRNGKKLDEAFIGFNRFNVFPVVGANGSATVHVNLGQAGFVFIEANVKKWGLAPSTGTLAPPPAYGVERDSILIATAPHSAPPEASASSSSSQHHHHHSHPYNYNNPVIASSSRHPVSNSPYTSSSSQENAIQLVLPQRNAPLPSSSSSSSSSPVPPPSTTAATTDNIETITVVHEDPPSSANNHNVLDEEEEDAEVSSAGGRSSRSSSHHDEHPGNYPTPNRLDISLHSLTSFAPNNNSSLSSPRSPQNGVRTPSPPPYNEIDPHRYAPGVAQAMLAEYGLTSSDSMDYEARIRSRSDRTRSSRSSRRRNHSRPRLDHINSSNNSSNDTSIGGWLSWIYGRSATDESSS